MKILVVLTSHDQMGNTENKTGFWLEEFTAPYYVFKDAGAEMVLASPKGGHPPLDPSSDTPDFQTSTTDRFAQDKEAQALLANTVKLNSVNADEFDAVFYPGGHGLLWDLVEDSNSIALLEGFNHSDKFIAAVCHAPAVFKNVKTREGKPLVNGLNVSGFSNSEEKAIELTDVVPFSLEDMLIENGGNFHKGEDWASYVIADNKLITGQNPASSEAVAKVLLEKLS